MNEPLRCEEALDLLDLSLDGELTPAAGGRLRSHLADCRSCAREMDLAVKIRRGLRELPVSEAGPRVLPFPRPSGSRAPGRIVLLAAMLALTVGGAIFLEQIRIRPAAPSNAAKPAEVARAAAEARYALAYIGKVSRHTGLDLRDGLLRRRLPLAATTDEP